jgi:hypothetical protein
VFEVAGAGGRIMLDVCLRRADNGESWVQVDHAYESPDPMPRLEHGLTISFRPAGAGLMTADLALAVLGGRFGATRRLASPVELSEAAGVDVVEELRAAGATAVGTRESLFADDGPRRRYAAVVFPSDEENAPVLGYVLTRVVALARAKGWL